ncbi:MAG: polyphosphate kinase 2 family protein, partial [Ignavibacteriae bacterium]|nr:polyphosphate kinase 2 family protein [Ignavibacteriota bacterium]
KFFLNLSKDEQKKRFIKRLDTPSKNWKFSAGDLEERKLWNKYQKYYQDAISETSTKNSPWYIVPADNKWFTRLVISDVIVNTLQKLKMKYPTLDAKQLSNIDKYKEELRKD